MKEKYSINSQQDLIDFVANDIKKNENMWYPLKASPVERVFRKKLPVKTFHPNPDDEFCFKEVGPSFRIINEYREQLRLAKDEGDQIFPERIIVEKMYPNGYMIINGHHRWAAAMLEREKRVRVSVVNLIHDGDLHQMLSNSTREKRVAMDLDEVIFATAEDELTERPNNFIRSHFFYKEKLKIGRANLINVLHRMGYDVWVYTRGYHSTEYIEKLFGCYDVKIDGVINGVGRANNNSKEAAEFREKLEKKYKLSLHIDNNSITCIDKTTRDFIQRDINCPQDEWSRETVAIINDLEDEFLHEQE